MKTLLLFIPVLFFFANCTQNVQSGQSITKLIFTGSTPGDNSIKSIIGIPANDSIDFMRWELVLEELSRPSFILTINYGLSQPNTNGFKPGHETLTIRGTYEKRHETSENFSGDIYDLITTGFTNDTLSLVKLNNNILHILQPDNSLMVGNGGWSYTLNLAEQSDDATPLLTFVPAEIILNDTSRQIIFDGRTPCSEISVAFDFNPPTDCIKLKWRLTLNRDPVTLEPSNYVLQRTDIRDTGAITGKWTVYCHNDSVVIYKLDPDKPESTLSFLAGDENVLFFLDKYNRLFAGNREFSYTLNRRNPV